MINTPPHEHKTDGHNAHQKGGAIAFLLDTLQRLRERNEPLPEGPSEARLGDVVEALDERAYGFLLLLLALPCCVPFIYVLPQLVALPMLALAGQLALGRTTPWLPVALSNRTFSIPDFEHVLNRSAKYIGWVERLSRPRLRFLSQSIGIRIVGALLMIPCASILVPLPSTNTLPGIGVAIASLGLIERDGLLILGGLMIGLLWVALLVFLGAEGVQLIKGWISNW